MPHVAHHIFSSVKREGPESTPLLMTTATIEYWAIFVLPLQRDFQLSNQVHMIEQPHLKDIAMILFMSETEYELLLNIKNSTNELIKFSSSVATLHSKTDKNMYIQDISDYDSANDITQRLP